MKTCLRVLLIAMLAMLSGCLFENPTPAPTDDELIKIFNDKREIFNQLITDINEDDYFIVSYDPNVVKTKKLSFRAQFCGVRAERNEAEESVYSESSCFK